MLVDATGVDAASLPPAEPDDLLTNLNSAASQARLLPWTVVTLLVLVVVVSPLFLLTGIPAVAVAAWRDRVRRSVVAFYTVDGPPSAQYQNLIDRFREVEAAQRSWHTTAEGAVRTTHQYKVNAGASTVVRRENLARTLTGPPSLASNIAIPALRCASRSFYLLPDRVLVEQRHRYVAISYDELRVTAGQTRFIEDGTVPSDAHQIDTTWKFVNKSGGPDRRFKDNRQLPVLLYGEVALSTPAGIAAQLSFSQVNSASALLGALTAMRGAAAPMTPRQRTASPRTTPDAALRPRPEARPLRPMSDSSSDGTGYDRGGRRPPPHVPHPPLRPGVPVARRPVIAPPSTGALPPPAAFGKPTFRAEVTCTVVGEEHHQDRLRTWLDGGAPSRALVARLGRCTITSGKYAGRTAIEVIIGGGRVGQLTHAMTERYLPLLEAVERRGAPPTAEALLTNGPRGVQVVLRLPKATVQT